MTTVDDRAPGRPATIVTGAGSGLGRALATSLAASAMWRVAIVGRRETALKETAARCLEEGGGNEDLLIVAADITQPSAAAQIVGDALRAFGRLDALVNNAGLARFAPIESADLGDLERMLATHLAGPVRLIREALPHLRRRNGTIVNIGSIGGRLALPQRSLYGASKAALSHLTRSLARELAPEVRVNAVLPGAIDTELYGDLGLDDDAVRALRAELVRTTPLGRMGQPEDVMPWIEMLLGPAGRWVTGSLLVIDGGRSC